MDVPHLSSRREKRMCPFSALFVLFKPSMNWIISTHILLFFLLFWLQWVLVAMRRLFSSCSQQRLFVIVVLGLLIAVPFLVEEHRLQGTWASVVTADAQYSRLVGSVVVVHGLSCSALCGIFLEQGSNPCPLLTNQQADFFFSHCTSMEVPPPTFYSVY